MSVGLKFPKNSILISIGICVSTYAIWFVFLASPFNGGDQRLPSKERVDGTPTTSDKKLASEINYSEPAAKDGSYSGSETRSLIEGDKDPDEKLRILLSLDKDLKAKYSLVTFLFRHLANQGASFEELASLATKVPAGILGKAADSLLYHEFSKREPEKVWQWLNGGGVPDDGLRESMLSRFAVHSVSEAISQGPSAVEDFILTGINPDNKDTYFAHGVERAIIEAGQAGGLSTKTLERILANGENSHLFAGAYRAWINGLEVATLLDSINLGDFPEEARAAAANQIVERLSEEPLDTQVNWVKNNFVQSAAEQETYLRQVYLQEIGNFRDGGALRIIPTLEQIDSQVVFRDVADRMIETLKNPAIDRFVPERGRVLTQVESFVNQARFLEKE